MQPEKERNDEIVRNEEIMMLAGMLPEAPCLRRVSGPNCRICFALRILLQKFDLWQVIILLFENQGHNYVAEPNPGK